jgi:DNA-binding transcriptional ArsR family regulator
MAKKKKRMQLDSYRISDLEQVKALAHPLRMRIIEALAASEPMTTKQVAESLGEKPTRLYHHVDLLEKTGLIRLTHTRQNRGTTEKYFEAIARRAVDSLRFRSLSVSTRPGEFQWLFS